MNPLDVLIGQRMLPRVNGERHTSATYAGFGNRHLMVIADGSRGGRACERSAQVATAAVVARFRVSQDKSNATRLKDAIMEAHAAVRRAAMGSTAEGQAGASLVAVCVEAERVTAARIGGGYAFVVSGGRTLSLFHEDATGMLGDGSSEPQVVTSMMQLPRGSRIIAMNAATGTPVATDLRAVIAERPVQQGASSLVHAARDRGVEGGLVAQMLEVKNDPPRTTPHPALRRITRGQVPTFDADGRRVGVLRSRRRRFAFRRLSALTVALFGLSAAGFYWWNASTIPDESAPEVQGVTPPQSAGPTLPPTSPPSRSPALEVEGLALRAPPPPPPLPAPMHDASKPPEVDTTDMGAPIAPAFAEATPKRAARALKRHILQYYRPNKATYFDTMERWILANRSPHVVSTLLELMKYGSLPVTSRWLETFLPSLVSAGEASNPSSM